MMKTTHYQPYTVREYKTNVGKGNKINFGGLGPNVGSDEFVSAKIRNEARKQFGDSIRALNKVKSSKKLHSSLSHNEL